MTARGLPHSETRGSKPDCGSPGVSLLVCVLHRLVVPRHPPTAYHILPGHGLLGCRGQRPQRLWLGTSTLHGRYVIMIYISQHMNLLRYIAQEKRLALSPDVCNVRRACPTDSLRTWLDEVIHEPGSILVRLFASMAIA
jgi:hypothetical protein